MGGDVTFVEEKRSTYRVLLGKPERNRPLGGPMCR
jgi:hypothetical protein